jgi:hypothetical protein
MPRLHLYPGRWFVTIHYPGLPPLLLHPGNTPILQIAVLLAGLR